MSFWCYILKCADGKCYTGHTDDLERRFAEHQAGGYSKFTSSRRPLDLLWAQEFATREEALESELRVKKWSRAKKEALASGDWDRISWLSKPPAERVSTLRLRSGQATLDRNGQVGH